MALKPEDKNTSDKKLNTFHYIVLYVHETKLPNMK